MKHKPQYPESTVNFSQLTALRNVVESYSHLDEDYILTHFTASSPHIDDPVARRFDGMTMCICVSGKARIQLNLDEIEVSPNSILFIPPDAVFRVIERDSKSFEAYSLFLSNRFIHDINIDLNAINTSIFAKANHILRLDDGKIKLLMRYFDLLHINAEEKNHYSRYIARALASAAGYLMMSYAEEAYDRDNEASRGHSRKLNYVQKFLRLVRDNYRSQRAISFYAEQMFISPKYLSLIIKEATGKSAGEWIDDYVIQEAKNMLRYSGKNVQQIAYELNFSNQSSFGKYFKNITGMSPTTFQNSN